MLSSVSESDKAQAEGLTPKIHFIEEWLGNLRRSNAEICKVLKFYQMSMDDGKEMA